MKKPSKRLQYQLLRTVELAFVLNNWCADENRQPKDYTLDELIGLASERIDEFQEPGHTLSDGLMGTLGEEELNSDTATNGFVEPKLNGNPNDSTLIGCQSR